MVEASGGTSQCEAEEVSGGRGCMQSETAHGVLSIQQDPCSLPHVCGQAQGERRFQVSDPGEWKGLRGPWSGENQADLWQEPKAAKGHQEQPALLSKPHTQSLLHVCQNQEVDSPEEGGQVALTVRSEVVGCSRKQMTLNLCVHRGGAGARGGPGKIPGGGDTSLRMEGPSGAST